MTSVDFRVRTNIREIPVFDTGYEIKRILMRELFSEFVFRGNMLDKDPLD